ncbi:hypothetical protein [Thermococcus sp.]
MKRYLVSSIVGAPLFLFFINSVVGNKGFYVSFLYTGTTLFVGYVIVNIGSIVYREISMRNVVVDVVFIYILSLLVVITARSVMWPYNLVTTAVVIWILLTARERVVEQVNNGFRGGTSE